VEGIALGKSKSESGCLLEEGDCFFSGAIFGELGGRFAARADCSQKRQTEISPRAEGVPPEIGASIDRD